MIVSIKDAAKLFGISVIVLCSVWVCSMFVNFRLDIAGIEDMIATEEGMICYEAQVSTVKVVCLTAGGCLLATSVVMLFFYIKHYIDAHKKELGILKALGYSNLRIARDFCAFGVSVLIGAIFGLLGAYLMMPSFYRLQNRDNYLPEYTVGFHLQIPLFFAVLPAIAFALLAVFYAYLKLRCPALSLLRESSRKSKKIKKARKRSIENKPFLDDLKRSTLSSNKTLAFFMAFASFCYSAMTQMSFSMKDLSSEMMGVMMLVIGLVLAFVSLFLSVTTVVRSNTKTIAMMRVFGYSEKECSRAVLGCYRPISYIGFAVGTVYQYALLRLMVDIVFSDFPDMPEYRFDVQMMLVSLLSFAILYETVMLVYARKIRCVPLKEVMLEM